MADTTLKELLAILSSMTDEELIKFLYYARGVKDGKKESASGTD